jgi:hypothetical protein
MEPQTTTMSFEEILNSVTTKVYVISIASSTHVGHPIPYFSGSARYENSYNGIKTVIDELTKLYYAEVKNFEVPNANPPKFTVEIKSVVLGDTLYK